MRSPDIWPGIAFYLILWPLFAGLIGLVMGLAALWDWLDERSMGLLRQGISHLIFLACVVAGTLALAAISTPYWQPFVIGLGMSPALLTINGYIRLIQEARRKANRALQGD